MLSYKRLVLKAKPCAHQDTQHPTRAGGVVRRQLDTQTRFLLLFPEAFLSAASTYVDFPPNYCIAYSQSRRGEFRPHLIVIMWHPSGLVSWMEVLRNEWCCDKETSDVGPCACLQRQH